ncbi:uncharacterized protein LOC126734027 [Anthonomus grandis grandis]|uniref:uncharacterized protein LOC126734027 n=1 Tax=Anthonomus grandis grandis TaxID=2921223 RepID=UPI0021655E6B|nr:uncharacterized protein LOC126734027 [Anthonomus grandis grandis]
MLVSEGVQTSRALEKKYLDERVAREGMELLKRQKEEARRRKLQEQQEMKEMLERYWPWGKANDIKPRGLRNLRLEELYPNKDYQNAKRFTGTLDLGRPGCGAPIVRDGQKVTRTKEDPALRFQLGSKDLRRAVDNGFRYKTNKQEQMEYKKELDKMVEEKKQKQLKEKQEEQEFEKKQGWSNEYTLRKMEEEARIQRYLDKRTYDNFKKCKVIPPNRMVKLEPIVNPSNTKRIPGKNQKLAPLSDNKENGLELVDLLAKDRRTPTRAPLCSTDVTKEKEAGKTCIWNRKGSSYLKELTQQMMSKQQQIQEQRVQEEENSRRHYSTWTSFWGKPGNGAPRSAIKKAAIDRLLYPQMVPIGVA